MKYVQNIIKQFEVINRISYPCFCTAYYINTQETIKDVSIDDSQNTTIAIFTSCNFLKCDLKKQLQNRMNNTLKTRINFILLSEFMVEISHPLNYLHKKGKIHRDLKIENIMLNWVYQAKFVDFGLVRIHKYLPELSYLADSIAKGVGTQFYMSPEMLK